MKSSRLTVAGLVLATTLPLFGCASLDPTGAGYQPNREVPTGSRIARRTDATGQAATGSQVTSISKAQLDDMAGISLADKLGNGTPGRIR
jgi:hypothetical protein